MKTAKYFKDAEFKKCVPPCSIDDMDQDFLKLMDKVREVAKIPLIMTSAYRSVEWEKSKKRTGSGDHPSRTGVDFSAKDGVTKFKIIKAAIECGVRRIGVDKDFVHIGTSTTNPNDVVWLY